MSYCLLLHSFTRREHQWVIRSNVKMIITVLYSLFVSFLCVIWLQKQRAWASRLISTGCHCNNNGLNNPPIKRVNTTLSLWPNPGGCNISCCSEGHRLLPKSRLKKYPACFWIKQDFDTFGTVRFQIQGMNERSLALFVSITFYYAYLFSFIHT